MGGLATVQSVSLGVLPPVLEAWHRAHPGVRIRLFEHRHADELPAGDPAAKGNDRLKLATLAGHAWVHCTPGHGLADILDQT